MGSLTIQEIRRRQELTDKLKTRNLSGNEAEELRVLLEKAKSQAITAGDALAVLVIAVLIGLVIAYITDKK